jgi:L-lactate dehydrogenase complex protein LldG
VKTEEVSSNMGADTSASREEILVAVQKALGRTVIRSMPERPRVRNVLPEAPFDPETEVDVLLSEVIRLGGRARRLARRDLRTALIGLVDAERIERAVLWETDFIGQLGLSELLSELGVLVVPASADAQRVAGCDLGITGVDLALAHTGTLVLRSSVERSPVTSLLPRVHLVVLRATDLCPDLASALIGLQEEPHFVLITGPSRTADIELTVTLGVHGPRSLHVWALHD